MRTFFCKSDNYEVRESKKKFRKFLIVENIKMIENFAEMFFIVIYIRSKICRIAKYKKKIEDDRSNGTSHYDAILMC